MIANRDTIEPYCIQATSTRSKTSHGYAVKAVKNQTFPPSPLRPIGTSQIESTLNQARKQVRFRQRHPSRSAPCLGALASPGRKPRHLPGGEHGQKIDLVPRLLQEYKGGSCAIILLRLVFFFVFLRPPAFNCGASALIQGFPNLPPHLPSRPSILVLKFSVQRSRTKSVSHVYMHLFFEGSKYVDAKP